MSNKDKNIKNIISPCISICKTDPISGYCYGCARTNDEKIIWKKPDTTNDWKVNNLKTLVSRMNGWQLDSFKTSYEHKTKKGISIFNIYNKKNIR